MPVRQLCFEGPESELNRTESIQPCVMTVCWAAYEIWRESYGMEQVRVMAGHSLGEFTALAAAGAVSWETGLLLVKERGRIMAEASRTQPGGMLAIVGLDEARVETIRTEASRWASSTWPTGTPTSSSCCRARCRRSRSRAAGAGGGARRALILTVPLPAHSPLMEAARFGLRAVLDRLQMEMPEFPILANATGQAIASLIELRQELGNHLLRPVDWARTMVSLRGMHVTTVVELALAASWPASPPSTCPAWPPGTPRNCSWSWHDLRAEAAPPW